MANEDLAKLRIDKTSTVYKARRKKRPLFWIAVLLLVLLIFILYRTVFNPSVEVEVITVSQVYPSQSFTLLNASGYVVAQRKASVASKTTGRLEWLGVEEGNRVKSGQIIARLEGKDALALKEQAAANLNSVRSSLTASVLPLMRQRQSLKLLPSTITAAGISFPMSLLRKPTSMLPRRDIRKRRPRSKVRRPT